MKLWRRRRTAEPWLWQELAEYNARRAKGIAHTPEYVARMRQEQAAFNAGHAPYCEGSGRVVNTHGGYANGRPYATCPWCQTDRPLDDAGRLPKHNRAR